MRKCRKWRFARPLAASQTHFCCRMQKTLSVESACGMQNEMRKNKMRSRSLCREKICPRDAPLFASFALRVCAFGQRRPHLRRLWRARPPRAKKFFCFIIVKSICAMRRGLRVRVPRGCGLRKKGVPQIGTPKNALAFRLFLRFCLRERICRGLRASFCRLRKRAAGYFFAIESATASSSVTNSG